MTVNARPRSAAQLPVSSAPASALLRDGPGRASRGDRPANDRPRSEPRASGDRRRQAAPRSAMVVARPLDRVAVPRPTARELAAGKRVKGPVRERHEADPWIIIATFALSAVGVLIDLLLGRCGIVRQRRRQHPGHRPGGRLGGPGHHHDAGVVAHGLSLAAAHLGALLPGVGGAAGHRPGSAHGSHRAQGGGRIGSLADHRLGHLVPPRGDRQAGARHLPRALADPPGHDRWWAGLGHPPVPVHRGLCHRARGHGARPGHDGGHHAHRVHDVLRGRGQPVAAGRDLPLGMAAVWAYIHNSDYQLDRWNTFLNPWTADPNKAYHTIQGLLALGLGGVFGQGLGHSRQPGGLPLPNADNDFVFAHGRPGAGHDRRGAGRWGFMFIAWRGIRVGLRAPDTFGGLLAIGIRRWLAFQAFINIGVVVQLLPLTGITLPFVSAPATRRCWSASLRSVSSFRSPARPRPRGSTDDADPGRGRRHWRTHLPGVRRRCDP